MGKLIFPEIQFSVQFYLNSPERFLNAVGIQGKINNIKIKLFLCVVRLDNAIFRGIMTKINRDHHVMKYPAMRSEIRTWSVRAAWRVLEIQNLFWSQRGLVLLILVDTQFFTIDSQDCILLFRNYFLASTPLLEGGYVKSMGLCEVGPLKLQNLMVRFWVEGRLSLADEIGGGLI